MASRCCWLDLLQDKEAVASFCSSTLGQELATQELAIGGEAEQDDGCDGCNLMPGSVAADAW